MSTPTLDLNRLAAEAVEELGVPGAQVSVLHRGVLVEGVAGVANVETRVPVTRDTLFSIGSTTKVFTAVLAMQCAEAGAIDIDVPVVEQLPGFVVVDDAALRIITPRHLMSMTSGLDTDPDPPNVDHGRGDDAVARFVASLVDLAQIFPPGEGWGYSNAATNITGRLLEHVTGETWDDLLRTRLLEPAGLQCSATLPEEIIRRRFANGHVQNAGATPTVLDRWGLARGEGPCGTTLFSTASDLVRFASLFLHDGVALGGNRILSSASAAAMQAPEAFLPPTYYADWWGLGPTGRTWDGVDVLGHGGTTGWGSSYLLWAPERDIAVATTVNLPPFGYPFGMRMVRRLFADLAGIRVPDLPQPLSDVVVDTGRLVGEYENVFETLTVTERDGELAISRQSRFDVAQSLTPSRLIPLTPTTFLPTDTGLDGNRGWALAFLGPDDAPATHLLNGVTAMRRA